MTKSTRITQPKNETQVVKEEKKEEKVTNLHPHVAEALKAIQAERSGSTPLAWSDFSSHNKN